MEEVFRDFRKRPQLLELMDSWTTSIFRQRVFDLNARRYRNFDIQKCFKKNEDEKKRTQSERLLQVENATSNPIGILFNWREGRECETFYNRLARLIAEKKKVPFSIVANKLHSSKNFILPA